MSGEHLTNFSSLTGTSYGRRSSQLRFHEFSQECGTHRPHLIPPTARRSHPQKRCRVCYRQGLRKESRYCCPVCPGYPGLCVVPCFELYHADRTYQSAANLGFNLQEVDANFDITKALGLSTKSHMVVKQDSLGRRTVVSTGQHEAVIENEYVGPDEVEQFYANLHMTEEDYDDDFDRSMSDNLESDTELVSDAEQERQGQGKEPEHEALDEETTQQIQHVTEEVNEEVNEGSKDDTNEDLTAEAIEEINTSAPSEESPEDEPSMESLPEGEDQDSQPETETPIETIEIIPYGKNEESGNLLGEALESEKLLETPDPETRSLIKADIVTTTRPNTRTVMTRTSLSSDQPTISASRVTKGLSPQKITRVISASQLPTNVISSSQLQTKVISSAQLTKLISSPQLQTKVISSPQLQTKVISSPQLQTKVISSPQLQTKVISSPQLQTKVISSPQLQTKVISSPQLQTKVISSPQTQTKVISLPQTQTKLISASEIPGQRTTIKLSPSSFTGNTIDSNKILTLGAKVGGSNVITLPAGALAGGKATTIRIPSAGGTTKTYMITKTASGEIKKTPIFLKTVPAGRLPQASTSMTRTITRAVASSMAGGKSIIKTIVPKQQMIIPKQEPPSPPAVEDEDDDNGDDEDPTIDLVPTPTSLSTQVLKVLVGKPQPDGKL